MFVLLPRLEIEAGTTQTCIVADRSDNGDMNCSQVCCLKRADCPGVLFPMAHLVRFAICENSCGSALLPDQSM